MSPRRAMMMYDRKCRAVSFEIDDLKARLGKLQGTRTALHNLRVDASAWNPMIEALRLFCVGHERRETDALLDAIYDGTNLDAESVIDSCESQEEAAVFCQIWTRFQTVEMTMDAVAAIQASGWNDTPRDKVRETWEDGRLFDRELLFVWQEVDRQRNP